MRLKIKHCRHRFDECVLISSPCPHNPEDYSLKCPSWEDLVALVEQEAEV